MKNTYRKFITEKNTGCKKLLFASVTLLTLILGATSVSAACTVSRYKFDAKQVRINTSWNEDDAPSIKLGWSGDHTQDMTFYAKLEGAEWNYSKSGTIQKGVTYNLEDKHTLAVHVNVGTGDDEIEFYYKNDVYIPLYCTFKEAGDVHFIIDSNESTVSSADIVIAKSVDGVVSVSSGKAAIHQTGELKNINISDTSTQSYTTDDRFTLELDANLHFTGNAEVVGTGKFENRVKFEVDENDSSKAYVSFTDATPAERGSIVVKGAEVTRKSDKKFNVALLKTTFTASAVPLKSSIAVACYKADDTTVDNSAVQTTEETEAKTSTQVIKVPIGEKYYTIDGMIYSLDAPAYISNGTAMLPLRAMATAIGVADNNVKFNALTKTATLRTSNASAKIKANSDNISVTSNGQTVAVRSNTPAEIADGNLFLPLNDTASAFGISDSAISYDSTHGVVTIKR